MFFFSGTTTTTTTTTATTTTPTTTVSNSAIKRDIGNINDYRNANYFNYYRKLENKYNYLSDTFGLKTISNNETFKLIDFTIDSEMNNTCITSIWNQKYSNNSSTPVEGIYKPSIRKYFL
ncbi:hypothetical protein DDB_G0285977 [Dictyostelium discoideum AX4]|uniref:Uncharacterized protein n=1 Tax=Dictyostelium discoideum TaxID=44689 RepID=Q54MG3_DICDI|nr:hypothetical protein DDB_G0285977 [Dictyostelium discoideum AX4]EAL64447.1 hypothetical protein DDB_G0285977 [Dictyostelium discoideum AX4]|eukprot:XP_637951.1 hypothetical protein DDB_G0285977 [Dictyostelium discoideum AX4]